MEAPVDLDGNLLEGGEDDGHEETEEDLREFKTYRWSLWSINFLMVVMMIDATIILPSARAYLGGLPVQVASLNTQLAWSLSFFAAAQLVSTLAMGPVAKRLGSVKPLFAVMVTMTAIGNLIYAVAQDVPMALGGRVLAGFGAGSIGFSMAYITLVTPVSHRVEVVGWWRTLGNAGMLIGPGFASVLTLVDVDITNWIRFNGYTSPGWLMAASSMFSLGTILFVLKEPSQESLGRMREGAKTGSYHWSAPFILCCFYTIWSGAISTSFEYFASVITQAYWGYSTTFTSLFLMFVGIAVFPAQIVLVALNKIMFNSNGSVYFTLISWIGNFGALILVWAGTWESALNLKERDVSYHVLGMVVYCVGAVLINWWYAWASSVVPVISSTVIPPESRVTMMPFIPACMTIGRALGPTMTAFEIEHFSLSTMFIVLMVMNLLCVLTVLYWMDDMGHVVKSTRQVDMDDEGERLLGGGSERDFMEGEDARLMDDIATSDWKRDDQWDRGDEDF